MPTSKRGKTYSPAGTPIHTKHGLVPIEKIKKGDEVLSRNHATGKLEYERVTGLITPHPDRLMQISFAGEARPLQPTATHPFFVKHAGQKIPGWAEASVIKVGDAILTKEGAWSEVTAVSNTETEETVYNFEVEENHDYFIGEGGLLVHNPACGDLDWLRPRTDGLTTAEHVELHGADDLTKDIQGVFAQDPVTTTELAWQK